MARIPLLLSTSSALLAGFIGLGMSPVQASSGLSACLADCKRPQLSATNRASCRLDCENEAGSDPEQIRAQMARQQPAVPVSPGAPPADARAARPPISCKAGCDADRSLSVDDRASCKLDCEQEVLPAPGGPASPASPVSPGVGARIAAPAVVTPTPTQAGFLARCQATCRSGPGTRAAADFETCKLDCETMSSVIDVARDWVPDAWLAAPPIPMPAAPPVVTPAAPAPILTPAPSRSVAPAIAQGCGPVLERCNAGCGKQEAACGRSCARAQRSATDRETCKLTCATDREVCQGDCLSASATCLNSQAPR